MPVSPQDFALWSHMTGNPYPQTPAERMALAPEVYSYTRSIGRQGGPTMGPVRRAVDVVGKAALAAGALAGAAYLGSKYLREEDKEEDLITPTPKSPETVTSTVSEAVTAPAAQSVTPADLFIEGTGKKETFSGYPSFIEESVRGRAQMFLERMGAGKLELDNEPDIGSTIAEAAPDLGSRVAQNSGDVTQATTSDNYNQDVVPHQTEEVQQLRGTNPQKPTLGPIEQKTATQSDVIGSQQHFSPGNEQEQLASSAQPNPSIRDQAEKLIGRVSAGQIAKFRQSPSYAANVRSVDAEELIGDTTPYVEASAPSTVIAGPVRETPRTRTIVVKEESPIAEMAAPVAVETVQEVATPVTVTSPVPQSKTAAQMEDERLARMAFGNMPMEQATALLASVRAAKGSKTMGVPTDTPAPVITTRQPQPVRVSSEVSAPAARISPNEFLSAMSQQVGPVATYEIPAERSKAVRGLAFYPGGEIGVQMGKRKSGPTEYAYATSDPYRLALSDYAEEGFPGEMGNIGGIVADKALAHQMGLQQSVNRGGTIRQERQPIYTGLMSDADIVSAGMGKSGSGRSRALEQAERHFETKQIMQDLEERAARRRAGIV